MSRQIAIDIYNKEKLRDPNAFTKFVYKQLLISVLNKLGLISEQ